AKRSANGCGDVGDSVKGELVCVCEEFAHAFIVRFSCEGSQSRCPPRCYRDLAVTAPGPRCPRCPYAAYAGWVDARTPHSMSGAFSVLVWFNNAYADSVPMVPLGGDEGTRRYEQPAHGTSSCQRSGSPYGCGR